MKKNIVCVYSNLLKKRIIRSTVRLKNLVFVDAVPGIPFWSPWNLNVFVKLSRLSKKYSSELIKYKLISHLLTG